jgi:hypothetical protein
MFTPVKYPGPETDPNASPIRPSIEGHSEDLVKGEYLLNIEARTSKILHAKQNFDDFLHNPVHF